MKTVMTLKVVSPKYRSAIMPPPTQYHRDKPKFNNKYACRGNKGKICREDW